jgi:hypothetical protein
MSLFLNRADLAAQVDRFVGRIPKDVLRDVSRAVEEALAFAMRATWERKEPPWETAEPEGLVAALRGFVLYIEFDHTAGVHHDDFRSWVYFVTRERALKRFQLEFDSARKHARLFRVEDTTAEVMVAEKSDPHLSPLDFGASVMRVQFEPLLKSSRQRTGRLERLVASLEHAEHLHADEVQEFELVPEWEGAPAEASRIRDVVSHDGRKTYLVREWQHGCEPHDVREFLTLEEAVAAANAFTKVAHAPMPGRGYLQRKSTDQHSRG